MKKYIIPLFVLLLALSACNKEHGNVSSPEIDLGTLGNLLVPKEGGETVVEYKIANPVEGGHISAQSPESWIGDFNYDTPGQVVFNVEENTAGGDRSAIVTFTYTYGDGQSEPVQINVIQSSYDYTTECTFMTGVYYGTQYGINGEHNYFTTFSDMELLEDGAQAGGTYYAFDLYAAAAPENQDNPLPAAGTYVMGEPKGTADMTFTPEYTYAFKSTTEGEIVFEVDFTEGTLTVSYEGDTMIAEASMVDETGKTHYIIYTGVAEYDKQSGGSGGDVTLTQDLNIEASAGAATYVTGDEGDGVMEVQLSFTDMEVDFFGYVTPPGSRLYVDVLMPYDEDGNIAAGDYTVRTPTTELFLMYPGEYVNYMGMTFTLGTYVSYIDQSENTFEGLIDEGTMRISGTPGNYTVECTFTTVEGYSVKCSYAGNLVVDGMPGPYSTLTEDYTLDLEAAEGTAEFWGDYYGTGAGNWLITLDQKVGDCLQLDLMVEGLDFSPELATAVYKPSADPKEPMGGEYITGYLESSYLMGTNYMKRDGGGYLAGYAPAMDGDLNITNNGDNTYTISFAFTDDLGHVWDGEWTGTLNFSNESYAPAGSSARTAYGVQDGASVVKQVEMRLDNTYKPSRVQPADKILKIATR